MAKRNQSSNPKPLSDQIGLVPPFKRYTLEYLRTTETVVCESIDQVCYIVFSNVERLGSPDKIGFPNGERYQWGEKGTFLAKYYAAKGRISLEEFISELEIVPTQDPAPRTGLGTYKLIYDFPVKSLVEAVNCALEIANTTSIKPDRILLPSGELVAWDGNSAVRLIKGLITPLKFVFENLEDE